MHEGEATALAPSKANPVPPLIVFLLASVRKRAWPQVLMPSICRMQLRA
jgi:hypothetical protein